MAASPGRRRWIVAALLGAGASAIGCSTTTVNFVVTDGHAADAGDGAAAVIGGDAADDGAIDAALFDAGDTDLSGTDGGASGD